MNMINNKILTLSQFLRFEGINVSIRSTIRASNIWDNFHNKFNSEELKDALRSVYVKNKEDIPRFERSYDYVFIYNKSIENNPLKQDHVEINTTNHKTNQKQKKVEKDTTRETIIKRRLKQKKIVDESILDEEFVRLDTIDYRVYDICRDFSKKVANHRSIRKKSKKSRSVNIPKTIRKNLKNGGHLINLIHQTPPMHKSKHIFLCDISGSCEWATTWFFAMLTGCHDSFDKLKLYNFDNRVIDVTHALDSTFKNSYQINVGLQSLGLRPRGHSDMTKSFNQFLKESELNKHTDVILLTDCRDWTGKRTNGVLESAKVLHKIIIKSRNVIILNPENKYRWNTPTSCVRDYQEVGAKVYETSTLKQFAKVIKEI